MQTVASGTSAHLSLCALVLEAVGILYRIDRHHGHLEVAVEQAATARAQLARYFEENRNWPERPPTPTGLTAAGNPPTLLVIGGLILFYLVTGPWQDNNTWFISGAIDSDAVLNSGEWWRLVTALTLHADQVHLLGNSVIGGLIVHLLGRTLGYGTSLLLLVACGATGNLLNIAARSDTHLSVGFSTSVFAAIGIFSGLQAISRGSFSVKHLLLALGAGGALLAMLGVSGERTDLGAHLFGFLCGAGAGMVLGWRSPAAFSQDGFKQPFLAMLSLGMVLVCWRLALR